MINHISLNGILLDVEKNENSRKIKVIRSYKNREGNYDCDIFDVIMWSRNKNNSLFSYKSGTLVSVDGRLETINSNVIIVVESLTYLAGGEVNFNTRSS